MLRIAQKDTTVVEATGCRRADAQATLKTFDVPN